MNIGTTAELRAQADEAIRKIWPILSSQHLVVRGLIVIELTAAWVKSQPESAQPAMLALHIDTLHELLDLNEEEEP